MRYFCQSCGDKLEEITVMKELTEVNRSRINWSNQALAYCDNEACEMVGIVLARAKTTRPTSTSEAQS
jgi:hypothetical protein